MRRDQSWQVTCVRRAMNAQRTEGDKKAGAQDTKNGSPEAAVGTMRLGSSAAAPDMAQLYCIADHSTVTLLARLRG